MSDPLIIHLYAGWWSCPECQFRRYYETDRGAFNGAARHMKDRHALRLTLPRRHHGGLYGAGR